MQSMGQHLVLTGGASQLVGVRELATSIFGKKVRIGKPKSFSGLAESVSSAGFSAAVGMLHYAKTRPFEEVLFSHGKRNHEVSVKENLKKIAKWLKERF